MNLSIGLSGTDVEGPEFRVVVKGTMELEVGKRNMVGRSRKEKLGSG